MGYRDGDKTFQEENGNNEKSKGHAQMASVEIGYNSSVSNSCRIHTLAEYLQLCLSSVSQGNNGEHVVCMCS